VSRHGVRRNVSHPTSAVGAAGATVALLLGEVGDGDALLRDLDLPVCRDAADWPVEAVDAHMPAGQRLDALNDMHADVVQHVASL
jgi:hypothetical protein